MSSEYPGAIAMMRMTSCLSLPATILWMTLCAQAADVVLEARQEQLTEMLGNVSPAVVAVTDGRGFGTGVVVTGDGIVLTASHVVENPHRSLRRRSERLEVLFPDGSTVQCKLLGRNRYCDAAVLKILEKPKGDEFSHVEMGHSSEVERGDWCFALGHPGGRRDGRPAVLRFGRTLSVSDETIVSDNAIVLGDSGGPLFDLQGRLIGIHSMISRVIVENRHVAIDVWRRDWDRLLKGDTWGQLRVSDDEIAASGFVGLGLHWHNYNAEVTRIISNSPASRAGFRPGDELLRVKGRTFAEGRTFADRLGLSSLLARLSNNEEVDITVRRRGELKTLTITTGTRSDTDADFSNRTEEEARVADEVQEEFNLEFREQIGFQRRVGSNEKRSPSVLRDYADAARKTNGSVVQFIAKGKPVAFGIVMSESGDILTKASEISRAEDSVCILPNGSQRSFRRIGTDISWDLMLVKVNVTDLTPIQWENKRPSTGRLLISPDSDGRPILPGVVSIPPLTLTTSSQGFLGVRLDPDGNVRRSGARVSSLVEGGAAARDGIVAGDVILSVDGKAVRGVSDTMARIKSITPNQLVKIQVSRRSDSGETIRTIAVTLTPRFVSDPQDALLSHYRDQRSMGRFASVHNSGFPEVIQHDTDLFPHQCGGPVLDIHGKAVGMNIARAARIISYAIPADAVQRVYQSLQARGLAAR